MEEILRRFLITGECFAPSIHPSGCPQSPRWYFDFARRQTTLGHPREVRARQELYYVLLRTVALRLV